MITVCVSMRSGTVYFELILVFGIQFALVSLVKFWVVVLEWVWVCVMLLLFLIVVVEWVYASLPFPFGVFHLTISLKFPLLSTWVSPVTVVWFAPT
jgi:hypothetical protein